MNRKSIIVFVLAAAVIAAALVFDGLSHRRNGNSNQTSSQNPVAAPSASGSANSSTPGTDGQQPTPAANATAPTDNGQNAAPADASQPDQDAASADAAQPSADNAQPATAPIVVPPGTTLAVRLGEELGSSISQLNQRFSASLDRDIVVDGQTVIAAGAAVTGKVVLVRPAGAVAGEANLQLKIISVNVNNANLAIVTGVRSFGPQIKGKNKVGRFMKGLVKRASGEEREVFLPEQSACNFTLQRRLEIP